MADSFLHVLLPVAGVIVDAIVQVVAYRFSHTVSLIKSVFAGCLAGLACLLALEWLGWGASAATVRDSWFLLGTNVITYSGLAVCYWTVIGLGLSLRIRILDIVAGSESGLSLSEIEEQFDCRGLFRRRLNRLVQNGQILEENGRFFSVDSAFLATARLNAAVKRFLVGRTSEFEAEERS